MHIMKPYEILAGRQCSLTIKPRRGLRLRLDGLVSVSLHIRLVCHASLASLTFVKANGKLTSLSQGTLNAVSFENIHASSVGNRVLCQPRYSSMTPNESNFTVALLS